MGSAPRSLRLNAITEGRGCSECSCGSPAGGLCIGRFVAYADSACSATVAEHYPIKSTGPTCIDLVPSGPALGSEVITDLQYMSGTCAASGGEPVGVAEPNPEGAMTVCCLPDPEMPR